MTHEPNIRAVEAKLDFLIDLFEDTRKEMRQQLGSQEKRISSLEQWRSRATGIYIGVSTVIGYMAATILK